MPLELSQIENANYEEQFALKKSTLNQMLGNFCVNNEISFLAFKSDEKHYRMRVEFRVWHQGDDTFHIMFNQKTKEKYRVDTLDSANVLINDAMQAVIAFIKQSPLMRQKLFQIDYLSSTTNDLVISLLYHKKLDDAWECEAEKLRGALHELGNISLIGRAKKQKHIIGVDYVNEIVKVKGKSYGFKHIENSFTQPNANINEKMIEWVVDHASDPQQDLLELYCGAGNFSIPLSHYFNKVLATEISKTSVNAAQDNIRANNIENLNIARLSSEEFVQAFNRQRQFNRLSNIDLDDYRFSTVLVDPPRAGCDNTTLALMAQFDTIVYISCNPSTLKDNLHILTNTHNVVAGALFDQFPFTVHMEAGVILSKKK